MNDDKKQDGKQVRRLAGLLPGLVVAGAMAVPTIVDAATLEELLGRAQLRQAEQVQVLDSQIEHVAIESPTARPIWGKAWTRYDWLKVCPC